MIMTPDCIGNFTILCILVILVGCINSIGCQFITHFDGKELKGNITFDVREESNESILVVESYVELNQLFKSKFKDEEISGITQSIVFDWSVHSNSIKPTTLSSCSIDDLGQSVSNNLKQSLTENRRIILNKYSQWTIPLRDFLQSNSVDNLSALLWGKSIRLSLASFYADLIPRPPPAAIQVPSQAIGSRPKNSTGSSGGLSKPILKAGVAPSTTAAPIKPVFAPRPKPNISGKLKTTSSAPMLPKPLALILETTQSSKVAESKSIEISLPRGEVSKDISLTNKDLIETTETPVIQKDTKEEELKNTKRILRIYGNMVACGNIIDTRNVKTAEAVFESQISGRVTLRGNEDGVTLLMLNLYHIKSKVTTKHDWKILSSDILDNRRHEDQCKYLQVLFDPNNVDDSNCTKSDMTKCKMGDLTKKHGQIQIAGLTKSTRTTLVDTNLPLSSLEGSRQLFLVIYAITSSPSQTPSILSCTQIKSVSPRIVEAVFNMDGVRGSYKFLQRFIDEPTTVTYDLFGLEGNIKHQSLRELPVPARTSSDNSKLCNSLGDIFNPVLRTLAVHDAVKLGNLSFRHGPLSVIDSEYEDHYMGEFIDLRLQLYETQTIVGRSIVIHKNNGDSWVCATLEYADEPLSLAVARFNYPVVGQIMFQQLTNYPNSETGVLVEVYNPNSDKSTVGHNWLVHLNPAMADFYNWSQRCESSGEVFDPIQVATTLSNDHYNRQCSAGLLNEPLRCRLGDVSAKSGFKLSLPVSSLNKTRYYYTDPYLPLTKLNSIIGRSVVIYDENAPTQRGNRLACSTIRPLHSLKASLRSWNSGPSIPSAVSGSIVFEQESPTKQTKIKVDLSGFNGQVENYAIHNVWTMDDKEFPCSNDSLYDIYDPFDNENSSRLPASAYYGSSTTVDRVKVGDMSRKHGTFEGLQSIQKTYVDANLPLFAPHSIIGRSMVLRAVVNDFRWVCGNIELDYDKAESREIIGLASFDEPRSKISGYVRFKQLEHKDGSFSDTYIHVDLRMQADGIHELQTSEEHNWAVFVNQVGEDAFIAADEVRCIASGFKWNPYLAQDTIEAYTDSCNPSEQLACAMGDLGLRHGLITLGPNSRRSISDSNLPLVGNYSVLGRSLIIFDNKRPTVKLACANIYPDIHLKSNVVIKRTPSFTVARFVEQMRDLLGAAEWLMVPELRATKAVANGECVQMTIHFYGQKAHQMQVELNNLITLGTVRKSSRVGVDKISTHYKLCRAGQTQLTGSANCVVSAISHFMLIASLSISVCLLCLNFVGNKNM